MELKDKIFRFGIYGEAVSLLTNEELDVLKNKKWVEFLSYEQVLDLKNNFSLSPLKSAKLNENENFYVRMNPASWKAYLFGPDFVVKKNFYYLLIDYLLKNADFTPASKLRSLFNIDPKTMHYLCKKLKKAKIITEKKQSNETYIKLDKLVDRSALKIEDIKENTEKVERDLSKLIYYLNCNFLDQLRMHVDQSIHGIGCHEMTKIFGLGAKISLKNLQRLCLKYPEEYKLVESIENGHTLFKCFHWKKLEERNRIKAENMRNTTNMEKDTLLSSKDRQEALSILANKYKHFVLSKEIIAELQKMTGYPYEIDRKNLIKNAKEAGLKIYRKSKEENNKYVIALPNISESEIFIHSKYTDKEKNMIEEESECYKRLKKYFLHHESFILSDNCCINKLSVQSDKLIEHLVQKVSDCSNTIHFDFDFILQMPVHVLFNSTKIKKANFFVKCVYDLYRKGILKSEVDIDSFYIPVEGLKKINPDIYSLVPDAEMMKLKDFMDPLSNESAAIIRSAFRPMKFMKKLNYLKNAGKIDLEFDDEGRIFIRVNKEKVGEDFKSHAIVGKIFKNIPYNTRIDFILKMRNVNDENIREMADEVIRSFSDRALQKMLKKQIKIFLGDNTKIKTNKKERILNAELHPLYLDIKKALIFEIPIDFRVLGGYENIEIEEVLEYMNSQEVISGYRSMTDITKIFINTKHKSIISGFKKPTINRLPSNSQYFHAIFDKIYDFIKNYGTVDFKALVEKLKFFEPFELQLFLDEFKTEFDIKESDGFRFVSISKLDNPFDL